MTNRSSAQTYASQLRVLLGPHKILSQKSKDVSLFNDQLSALVERMEYLMDETKGIGLAAPQVGLNKNLFITKIPDHGLNVIINPKIISTSQDLTISNEGCLSFPGIEVSIERHSQIEVQYYNLKQELITEKLEGMDSICFQHEYDHLIGVTTLDRIKNNSKRKAMSKIVEKQKQLLLREQPHLYYDL